MAKASTGKRKQRNSESTDPTYNPQQEGQEYDDSVETPPVNVVNDQPSQWAKARVRKAEEYPNLCSITHKVNYTGTAVVFAHVIDKKYNSTPDFIRYFEWFLGLEANTFNINQSENLIQLCLELHDLYDNGGILIVPTLEAILQAIEFVLLPRAERVARGFHTVFPRGLSDFNVLALPSLGQEYDLHIKDTREVSPGIFKETGTGKSFRSPFEELGFVKLHINPIFAAFKAADSLSKLPFEKTRVLESMYGRDSQAFKQIQAVTELYRTMMNKTKASKVPRHFLNAPKTQSPSRPVPSSPSQGQNKRSKKSKTAPTVAGPKPQNAISSTTSDLVDLFQGSQTSTSIGGQESDSQSDSDESCPVEGLRSGRLYKAFSPRRVKVRLAKAVDDEDDESDGPDPETTPSRRRPRHSPRPPSPSTSSTAGPSRNVLFGQSSPAMVSSRIARRTGATAARQPSRAAQKATQVRSKRKGPSKTVAAPQPSRVDRKGKAPMYPRHPLPSETPPSIVGESNPLSHDLRLRLASDSSNADRNRLGKGRSESRAAAFKSNGGGHRPVWK